MAKRVIRGVACFFRRAILALVDAATVVLKPIGKRALARYK
jgi:hypothetical protein